MSNQKLVTKRIKRVEHLPNKNTPTKLSTYDRKTILLNACYEILRVSKLY